VTDTVPTRDTDDDWLRVHPLTPLLRSWQLLVVLGFVVGQNVAESVAGGDGATAGLPSGLAIGVGIAVVVALGAIGALVSWRFMRYRVTVDALEMDQGVLWRRHRRAPLDRLQAVDIVQPLVGRVLGLAQLTLEVAGGGDSRIRLAYLTEARARTVRDQLLATAAGLHFDAVVPQVGESPEDAAIEVSFGRLAGSIVCSWAFVLAVLSITGMVAGAAVTGSPGPLAFAAPILFGGASTTWKRLTGGFGFRVATAADGVRLRSGMFEQRTQTVPPGRVQAIRLSQPLLWRPVGWWQVAVNVAGYGGGGTSTDGSISTSTLLPVGTRAEALAILGFVVRDLAPESVIDAGLTGTGDGHGYVAAPRRARWVDPIGWRRRGFRVADAVLLVRRGRLHRELDVVPHARTQSCAVVQGPVLRRLGLASFELHSTPGVVAPNVEHLASDVAAALLDAQIARARTARTTARDAWLDA
jgi:putative membrane protein